jgi:hypothetical protein
MMDQPGVGGRTRTSPCKVVSSHHFKCTLAKPGASSTVDDEHKRTAAVTLPAFREWRCEAAIIGRLLAGYGEFEFQLALCVGHAVRDVRQAIRDIFTIRGAEDRIKLAKKMAREPMRLTGLKDQFAETLAAVRVCKGIRNDLAHCHWATLVGGHESDGLFFVNVEDAAREKSPKKIVYRWQHASLSRLQQMESYFDYTRDCLLHVEFAMAAHRGQPGSVALPVMPTKQKQPPKTVPASRASVARLPKDF